MSSQPKIPLAEQRSEVRSAIGSQVAAKLAATPNALRVPYEVADIYLCEDFLSPAECAALVAMIDADCMPSTLYNQEAFKDYRTSSTCHMDENASLVGEVNARLVSFLGVDAPSGEPLQGQRYAVGQEYKQHSDFFYITEPYWPAIDAQGGQRTWTAMAYLNDIEGGGATLFPRLGLEVEPRAGRLLVWNNMSPDGAPNPMTLHCGSPVAAGCKYVITKWFRERPWTRLASGEVEALVRPK